MNTVIISAVVFIVSTIYVITCSIALRSQRKTIEAQQDTIRKLINSEPVTYKEVGKEQPKDEEVRYSAWGSRMLTKDDYNKEQ